MLYGIFGATFSKKQLILLNIVLVGVVLVAVCHSSSFISLCIMVHCVKGTWFISPLCHRHPFKLFWTFAVGKNTRMNVPARFCCTPGMTLGMEWVGFMINANLFSSTWPSTPSFV